MSEDENQRARTPATTGKQRQRPALPRDILRHARDMRLECTDAELLLWRILRNRRFEGFKFRRQHPVGRYIVDFYCHEATLAIELDGGDHDLDRQAAYDAARDAALEAEGIRVLRFWNTDLFQNLRGVLEEIYDELTARCPSPPPFDPGGPT